jgi:signal transduction histidine kinase
MVRYISFRRLHLKLRVAEQQAAIERERGRIARDIHDDLGNRLTKIQLLTGLAQRDRTTLDKTIAQVRQISSTARQATDALDEIVWAINPHNDTLPHLINYLGQFAVEFLRAAGIRCRVDLPDHPPAKSVSAEVRHNLFLAIKESLNNIVRHANATEVSLIVLVTDESISVIIEDNGCGFNGEVKSNGADGLENMRQRMVEIGGQFQIKSTPGTGTWVSFNGPWLDKR